jgi:hypothetical protein
MSKLVVPAVPQCGRRMIEPQQRWMRDTCRIAFFRFDPVGLNFGANTDEYDPEVGTILPHLCA